MTANGYEVSFWGDDDALKLTAAMAAAVSTAKNH